MPWSFLKMLMTFEEGKDVIKQKLGCLHLLCNRRYKAEENLTPDIFLVRAEEIIQSCSQKVERGEISEEHTEGMINFQ